MSMSNSFSVETCSMIDSGVERTIFRAVDDDAKDCTLDILSLFVVDVADCLVRSWLVCLDEIGDGLNLFLVDVSICFALDLFCSATDFNSSTDLRQNLLTASLSSAVVPALADWVCFRSIRLLNSRVKNPSDLDLEPAD